MQSVACLHRPTFPRCGYCVSRRLHPQIVVRPLLRHNSHSSTPYEADGSLQQRLGRAGAAFVALGIAVGIAIAARQSDGGVPADVAALCAEAHALSNTPMSAAAKYKRALVLLDAHAASRGGANALQRAELLMLLGDAQHNGRQFARAHTSFAEAAATIAHVRATAARKSSGNAPGALDLMQKHALLLDRLASVAADAGDSIEAQLSHLDAAVGVLSADDVTKRLLRDAASGDSTARQRAADAAGIYFNRSVAGAAAAVAARATSTASASSSVHDALRALYLVGSAYAGATNEALSALQPAGSITDVAGSLAESLSRHIGDAVDPRSRATGIAIDFPGSVHVLALSSSPPVCSAGCGCRRLRRDADAALRGIRELHASASHAVTALREVDGAGDSNGGSPTLLSVREWGQAGVATVKAVAQAIPTGDAGVALSRARAAVQWPLRARPTSGYRDSLASELQLLGSLADAAVAQLRNVLDASVLAATAEVTGAAAAQPVGVDSEVAGSSPRARVLCSCRV